MPPSMPVFALVPVVMAVDFLLVLMRCNRGSENLMENAGCTRIDKIALDGNTDSMGVGGITMTEKGDLDPSMLSLVTLLMLNSMTMLLIFPDTASASDVLGLTDDLTGNCDLIKCTDVSKVVVNVPADETVKVNEGALDVN